MTVGYGINHTIKREIFGQPSEKCNDIVQSADQRNYEKNVSQFQNFHVNFHKFHTILYKVISQAVLSQVLCKMGFKNTHVRSQNAENGFGFDRFLEQYNNTENKVLSHTA
jgi:hypothetical protein